jgi:hypothetical protein
MLFPHPLASASGNKFGDAVSSANFDGSANMTATLGSFYWLGFKTTGLSPDKKRLALLGAQRLKCGTAGFRRLERSELAALSAVATTDLFVFFGFSWLFPNGDLLSALVLQQVPGNNDRSSLSESHGATIIVGYSNSLS